MSSTKTVTRIQDELEALTQIVSKMRVQFGREVGEWEKTGNFRLEMVRMGKELTTMVDSLLSLKIRFDKAQKELADSMSPEDERKAVTAYLRSCTPRDRSIIWSSVKASMVRRGEAFLAPGELTNLPLLDPADDLPAFKDTDPATEAE